MKRRDFLTLFLAATGTSSSFNCRKEIPESISCAPTPTSLIDENLLSAGSRTTVVKNPLQIPQTVGPSNLKMTCKSASVPIGGGKSSTALTYDGLLPAKTIVANNGDTAVVTITNNLTENTTTHWHGLIVSPENDGGTDRIITSNGGTYNYNFNIIQRASLNWYHPHPHMNTGRQVNLGMSGLFIIRDTTETSLGLPSGEFEIPLIIRDATLDKNGNLSYKATSSGFVGQNPMVNGTLTPYLSVKPRWYRFRVLNTSNARVFKLSLNNNGTGKSMILIGNDGGLLDKSYEEFTIDFSPAERLDLLINFTGLRGKTLSLKDDTSGWELLEFRVQDINDIASTIPTNLTTIESLSSPVTTRVFSFDGMTMINGKTYDMNRIDWEVPFGTTEKWVFKTSGNGPHPVHVHGASFQVISRTGGRAKLYNWEKGWKDTVLLQDGETIEVLIRFTGYKGRYLLHCHKLEHEDAGMMANFLVV